MCVVPRYSVELAPAQGFRRLGLLGWVYSFLSSRAHPSSVGNSPHPTLPFITPCTPAMCQTTWETFFMPALVWGGMI